MVVKVNFLLIFLLFAVLAPLAHSQQVIEVGKFSAEKVENNIPSNWKPLTFKKIERHTTYSLVKDEGTIVVKAVCESSASGLVRGIKID